MYLYVTFYLVMTSWETCNKYLIKNSLGQQVYFAKEGQILAVYMISSKYNSRTVFIVLS